MDNDLEVFADQIISELGVGDLPEEKQASILQQMGELWLKRISAATFERLGDEKADEYLAFAETHTPEEAADWIKKILPDYEAWVATLRKEFLDEMKALAQGK